MIIHIKTAFAGRLNFDYADQYYFKSVATGKEKVFNLIQMMFFELTSLEIRFKDADYHG